MAGAWRLVNRIGIDEARRLPHQVSIESAFYGRLIDRDTVTLSPKFQVVVPPAVRRSLGLEPGEKLQVLGYEGRIERVPLRPMRELRGVLGPIDTSIERDDDRP